MRDPEEYTLDEALSRFEAYAEYVGSDSIQEFKERSLTRFGLHRCSNCEIEIPVVASDPQAYGPVLCPDCGEICDYTNLRSLRK